MGNENSQVTISVYELDMKRNSFARLVASGQDIGEAYNIAFHTSLSYEDSFGRGKELCENKYVAKKINEYCDDNKVLSTINRRDVAISLKRIADCDAADFYKMDNGLMVLKPLDEWTRSMRAAFAGIKYSKTGIELKTHDKIASLNSIIRMMGWDKSPDESATSGNEMAGYSDDQLDELISSMDEIKEIEDNSDGGPKK